MTSVLPEITADGIIDAIVISGARSPEVIKTGRFFFPWGTHQSFMLPLNGETGEFGVKQRVLGKKDCEGIRQGVDGRQSIAVTHDPTRILKMPLFSCEIKPRQLVDSL